MRNCPACGREIQGEPRFCGHCGAATDHRHDPPTETSIGSGTPPRSSSSGPRLSSDPRFLPGTVLANRYRLVGPLGRGGMGEVYRADDLKLGQAVALKFLPEGLEQDPDRLERFLNEVKLARQVAHPNVCRVYDVGEFEGQHFISMEFVDGEDLASLLRRIGRLPQDKAIELSRQICAGLAAAHELGFLHRDLKPANVMVDGRGRAKIADFGLAGLPESIRGAEILTGTPTYMAPEQLAGKQVSIQSDLYALGLVLYELFTGKPAYQADTRAELIRQQTDSHILRPSTLVDGIEPAVERAIFHCLSLEPVDRPRTALDVSAALPGGDPIAAALAAGETPSPDLVAAAGRAEALRPGLAFLLAATTIVLFALTGFWRGHYALRHYLPLEKRPIAFVDDARQMIRALGYTEPLYDKPLDEAWGYGLWGNRFRAINRAAKSPADLEVLRDPKSDLLEFWYRQSPKELVPVIQDFFDLGGVSVSRSNPQQLVEGEILIALDAEGKLDRFAHTPRRIARFPDAKNELNQELLFGLAGLDPAEHTPTQPLYQRYMHADARWAWSGPSMVGEDSAAQVEVGMQEGRLAYFVRLSRDEIQTLQSRPESFESKYDSQFLFAVTILALWFGCAVLARSNIRKGRADERGAWRLGLATFIFTVFSAVLQSHGLFQPRGSGHALLYLGGGIVFSATVCLFYLGVEPHARRIWPSMLVSWSRLSGNSPHGLKDPLVGRSVLAGALGGSVIGLIYPAKIWLFALLNNGVPTLEVGSWIQLYAPRFTLSYLGSGLAQSLIQTVTVPLALVIGQLLFKRKPIAIAFALVVHLLLDGPWESTPLLTAAAVTVTLLVTAIQVYLLLRFGLVALFLAIFLDYMEPLTRASDWSLWHATSAWITLGLVAALAAYGYWAAAARPQYGVIPAR